MIVYILKSASCLALLLFFYHLVLEKEKMHNFNRYYLLIGVVVSLLIPFATITINAIPETIATIQTIEQPKYVIEETAPLIIEETIDYSKYVIGFYILISSILLIRFGRNLFKIIQKIRVNKQLEHKNATLVLVDDKILPHTFWNKIFINKKAYEQGEIEEELFTHELTHVTQKHTIDVLLIELLQVVFWINPLFIFLKKAIQLNHEFLADGTVINQHKNTFQYQHLLLNKAAWNNEYYLASNLNYSLTKKRLNMMTTKSSRTKILLKKLAVIPLLTGFVFLFAERIEAQEVIKTIYEKTENGKKLTDSEIYKEYVYQQGYIQTKDEYGNKIYKKYSELSKEEKNKVPPPPPLKSKNKILSKELFEKLKNNQKYAVWIDGKVVENEVLNKYKNSDFHNSYVSFIHANARSKRFPQNYQAYLETKKYFKDNIEKRVYNFVKWKKEKERFKKAKWQKGPDGEQIQIIESPTKEYIDSEIQKEYSSKITISEQSITGNKNNATLEELKEYNVLAKKYNKVDIEKRIIKLKDLNRLEILFNKLSEKQKKDAQSFPECIPSKPIIKNDNYREVSAKFIKSSYLKELKLYLKQIQIYKKDKSNYNKKLLNSHYTNIKYLYNKIDSQEKNIPPPPMIPVPEKDKKTIKPVNLDVEKDKKLILNGNQIDRKKIVNEIIKINAHLSKEEQKEYVIVSIIIPDKSYSTFVNKIRLELNQKRISFIVVGYKSELKKSHNPKHISIYDGLTINEAKIKNEKKKNKTLKKDSPWSISEPKFEIVEFIPGNHKLEKFKKNDIDFTKEYKDNDKIKYYLDGKKISKTELDKIKPTNFKNVNVDKRTNSIFIITKKATEVNNLVSRTTSESFPKKENTKNEINSGWIYSNNKTLFHVKLNGEKKYFNRFGHLVNKRGEVLSKNGIGSTGWKKINGNTYFYITRNKKTEYFDQKGNKVKF
ncbi:beta-lactamase regulating signal transducer with metallopeptidase domain [Lutibacter sp. Hel_I_33_5]|uniref:M56 family metallopeptidase n=1 Tax=Lutibacter sp. Hel_I_33_5 TaxID=1566289 RepID=UPI0011A82FBC|nr:M56 family metallopeptidase [Lutibacter sp. Hel_I_33_5]TVZ55850.1 beta-lactamase regulating signal transducer with metallopeptidase domain [Lutibacter sp. Hel_I_33_5]